MPTVDVVDLNNQKVSEVELADDVFGAPVNQSLLYEAVRQFQAGHRAGTLTKVGLGTFVDPRQDGGKSNSRTKEDLVRLMEIDGEEWLFYKAVPITVALIRGTTADLAGNITMEREALTLDALALAMAARNSNGFVIAQVERVCANQVLNPRQVQIPGVMVDCVVIAQPEVAAHQMAHHLDPVQRGRRRHVAKQRGARPHRRNVLDPRWFLERFGPRCDYRRRCRRSDLNSLHTQHPQVFELLLRLSDNVLKFFAH